jgi:ABC-2 type transport system permease protein
MNALRARAIPVLALAWKEIKEVVRQPRLLVVLVLGPFIILGLFGVGYQSSPPPLRTILVVPSDGQIAQRVAEIEEALEPAIDVVEISGDEVAARRRLIDREVDLVVVAPSNAVESIRAGEHAAVKVLHDTLDPFEAAYITIFSRASIDELNRAVLEEVAANAQGEIDDRDDALPEAREASARLSAALEAGDSTEARFAIADMNRSLDETRLAEDESFLSDVERQLTGRDETPGPVSQAQDDLDAIDVDDPNAAAAANELEQTLAEAERAAAEAMRLSPSVLARPFVADATRIVGVEVPTTTFYAPGVVIVLLQHVMLTFAALSLVREDQLGTTELFRVGPVSGLSILAGKYLGYFVIGTLTSMALVAGVVFGFGTPMAGDWAWLALVLTLAILASLGLGFAIATVSKTDSQAVQYSMMSLLFTIFFSGFVVSLSRLTGITEAAAYAVPATSAIGALQDIMFRGEAPRTSLVVGLTVYAIVGLIAGWWGLRRALRR